MLLSVQNNLLDPQTTLYSYTTNNGTVGGTAIPVRNLNGFSAQYAVQLGKTGEEQSEIVIIDTPAGTALPIYSSGTLKYSHALDTPVYQIHYDQVVFKRSTAGTAGTATALATVSITPDSMFTEYNDSSGAATYAYKVQYQNSVSSDLSSESDWFSPTGPTFYSLQKIRDRAKNALYSASYIRENAVIDDWINEWVELMTNKALKVNQAYSTGTAAYSFGTAGLGTVTEPLFKYASKIEITTDGVTYRNSSELPLNRYSSTDIFSAYTPRHSWQGDTVFQVLPFGNAGTAKMTLGKLSTQLVNETDELAQFLRGYTTGCIEYVLYRAYDLDQKDNQADKHFNRHKVTQQEFIGEITPRDNSGVKFIDILDGTGREDSVDLDYFL